MIALSLKWQWFLVRTFLLSQHYFIFILTAGSYMLVKGVLRAISPSCPQFELIGEIGEVREVPWVSRSSQTTISSKKDPRPETDEVQLLIRKTAQRHIRSYLLGLEPLYMLVKSVRLPTYNIIVCNSRYMHAMLALPSTLSSTLPSSVVASPRPRMEHSPLLRRQRKAGQKPHFKSYITHTFFNSKVFSINLPY